jgi:hypothetical protein
MSSNKKTLIDGDFQVGSGHLIVDTENNYVGFNNATPQNKIDVQIGARTGTHSTDKPLYVTGVTSTSGAEFVSDDGTAGIGIGSSNIFTTEANQNLTIAPDGTGAVGIKTATPNPSGETFDLWVQGDTKITGNVTAGHVYGDGSGLFNVAGTQWVSSSEDIYFLNNTGSGEGRVSIGTSTPVSLLTLEGTSRGNPPIAGTEGTSNAIMRIRDDNNVTLDIGTTGASPWTTWIQSSDATTMGTNYPISLNPNGGNVGVGTSSPGAPLEVSKSAGGEMLRLTNGTGSLYAGVDANPPFFGTSSDDHLRLMTNGTEKVRIESGGKVGIGTDTPSYKLDVDGDIKLRGQGFIYTANETSDSAADRYFMRLIKTLDASYPMLCNRTPNGDVVIATGTSSGGGDVERMRFGGGDGTRDIEVTNANFIVSGNLTAGTIDASKISNATVGDSTGGVKAVYFENTENSTYYTDKNGILAFDENFYDDTEYGTGTYDPDATFVGANGGGLLIKNEDGWGAIFTSQNTRWAKGYWNSLDVSGDVTATSFTGIQVSDVPTLNQDTTGNAGSATNVRVDRDDTGDTSMYITMVDNATEGTSKRLYMDNGLVYDNTNNELKLSSLQIDDYIYHKGNTGTYFGFDADDHFRIVEDGGNRFQVDSNGRIGIGTDAPASPLHVSASTTSVHTMRITHTDTNATSGTHALLIDANYSGSDTFTGDKANAGIYIDLDSSATGGGTAEEHRIYGVYSDVRHSGDSDICYSGFFYARSDHTSGQCSALRGVYASAQDSANGTNTNVTAGEFIALKDGGSTNTTATMMGVRAEVEIDAGTVTNAYAVHGHIDRDGGTITNGFLFHGSYAGSDTGVKWGLHLSGDEKNHVDGSFGIGTDAPAQKLDVAGRIRADTMEIDSYIYHVGDTNTYFGFDAADHFRIVEGGGTRFQVDSTGYVGIGTTAPEKTLHVNGTSRFDGEMQWGLGHTSHAGYSTNKDWYIRSGSSSGKVIIQDSGGNVGIGTASPGVKLDVSGSIRATGNVTAYSDRRAKSNIEKIQNPLEKIDKISGYTYTMKVKDKDGEPEKEERFTGLIAQEVLEILPEAVMGSEENHYSLAYGNMAGIFVEAIKELTRKNELLETQLGSALARLDFIERKNLST